MMVDCKCFRNLAGFAGSRPPCVVFTVCLAAFAIGLFSLGYFVQAFGWFDRNDGSSEDWNMFLGLLGSSEFCLFGNQSFNENSTNSTNITGPTPVGFSHVTIPVTLRLQPSEHFDSVFENITHVTSEVSASDLGLHGFHGNVLINITLSLPRPWTINCRGKKCAAVTFDTCGMVSLPVDIVPDYLSRESCNVSSVVSKVAQMSIWNSACADGIEAKAISTAYRQFTTAKALTMYDAVNLRLQYSSYFLFVLVISCVLYGMIKGKPAKQNFKKSNLPI